MEALQRAARRFGVEGPGRDVVGAEIVEQGARHRGLADPALVRAHHDHYRLCHELPLTRRLCSRAAIQASPGTCCWARTWQKHGRIRFLESAKAVETLPISMHLGAKWQKARENSDELDRPSSVNPAGCRQRAAVDSAAQGCAGPGGRRPGHFPGADGGSRSGGLGLLRLVVVRLRLRCRAGSASRPGSWPPANCTSACTRESTEGWVANRSAKPSRGLSTHNSITAEVAPGKLAAVLDLAQRRDHGVGVLGQFDRSGVGQQFARARQRQLDHLRQQPGQHDQRHRDDDDDDRAAAGALAVAVRGRGGRRRGGSTTSRRRNSSSDW